VYLVRAVGIPSMTRYASTTTTQLIYHGHLQLLVTVRRLHGARWVKRGNITTGANQTLFSANNSSDYGAYGVYLWFTTTDTLAIAMNSGTYYVQTSAVFRDVGGWYHVVVNIDTTQATSSNRVKIYINGEQQTSFATATYPTQNLDLSVNLNQQHTIGARRYTSIDNYFDGYMAEINFIDGQALTADDFGEINEDTGEWSPKRYAGTYGTNGFYLPFDGNANDSSGNGNNWTENNLASTDYMIDTPTNSFAVLNPLVPSHTGSNVFSQGNLRTSSSSNSGYPESTIYINNGKWYVEMCYESGLGTSSNDALGFTDTGAGANSFLSGIIYRASGQIYINGSLSTTVASFTVGNIVAMSIDADSGEVKFYKNNTLVYTGSSLTYTRYIPYLYNREAGALVANFGADSSFAGNKTRQGNTDVNGKGDFYYAPPAGGYLALCTDNLPAPAIEQPETHFNVVTYAGNGATQSITGLGFQPDFTWLKVRSTANDHTLQNVISGNDKFLKSNTTDAEGTNSEMVSSFDSDGFTLGPNALANQSGQTYVAWCWKAGGTAVSNTDGTITSQVSANTTAGFSIISYTGVGYPNATTAEVGHGLDLEPELVIIKKRGGSGFGGGGNWTVGLGILPSNNWAGSLYLNDTGAYFTGVNYFWNGSPTSSVIKLKNDWFVNGANNQYIAYAFHSVEGFSKIGTYVGNGSTNGPFVYTGTGFKPAFVMIKRTDSTQNWPIVDTSRDTYNIANKRLFANLSNAEDTGITNYLDLLSNGFKCRDGNVSYNALGGTYIYMAFAEHPFKYATGR
jgi:hypothetical protein